MGTASSGYAKCVFFRDVSADQSVGWVGQIPSLVRVGSLVFSVLLPKALRACGVLPPTKPHPLGAHCAAAEEMSGAVSLLMGISKSWLCSTPQAKICLAQWCVTGVVTARQTRGPFASRALRGVVFLLDMLPAQRRRDFQSPKERHGISQSSTPQLVFKRCLA